MNSDNDFIELRKHVDPEFENLFKACYDAYLKGDWSTAGKHATALVKLRPDDGPSVSLNNTINNRYGGKAPETWAGFRELTSK